MNVNIIDCLRTYFYCLVVFTDFTANHPTTPFRHMSFDVMDTV